MNTRLLAFAGALVLTASTGGAQQTSPALVETSRLRMQPEAAEAAFGNDVQVTVFGDPAKPGLYAIRRRFKPGEMSRPHFRDQDGFGSCSKGMWYTGKGDVFQPEKTSPVKTGGFMLHPKGFHHYDGAKSEEVIVQIIGVGPVQTTNTEVKR